MKHNNQLIFKPLGIHTRNEHCVFMKADCHVCLSEGFEALTRIQVHYQEQSLVANLMVIDSDILDTGEISLSQRAVQILGIKNGNQMSVSHLEPMKSLSFVRSKIYGHELNAKQLNAIVNDIVEGHYSNIHLSAFITAFAGNRMKIDETIALTRAMISSGDQIHWTNEKVVDKHCIGGLSANRTTPIIVAIVAAYGLVMPKTSSRAITSPAGTADTMEVITEVELSMQKIKEVVKTEGACIAWGGTAQLSPADDILIKVEKALDIDSEGQLIASVLSKKVAAGSKYVVIDMPVGATAKLRSRKAALDLQRAMEQVAEAIGLKLKVLITDGSQPVGNGIGPALEAADVLSVLKNEEHAPVDLKQRALLLAGELLELSGKVEKGEGLAKADELLKSGKAYEKFVAICKAQGRFTAPKLAAYKHEIIAEKTGVVSVIDNRKLAMLAKLSGAPHSPSAGILLKTHLGDRVDKGQLLYIIYAESIGELNYAMGYYQSQKDILTIH